MAETTPEIVVRHDDSDTETCTDTDAVEMEAEYKKVLQSTDTPRSTDEKPLKGTRNLPPLKMHGHQIPAREQGVPGVQIGRGFSHRTDQGIISIPQGTGMEHAGSGGLEVPTQTKQGMISIPGQIASPGSRRAQAPKATGPPLDIVVYFMDKTGLTMPVLDGQRVEAGELFEMVMDEMDLPHEAREIFSLWMVSDLLELQLKPNHVPFKLACQWDELLEKYTKADQEDIERDEPVVMFQRNVFYTKAKEKEISDPRLIRLLYHEAKENVVDGRYPVDDALADRLAGMHALVKNGQFSLKQHNADFYKNQLNEYYPANYCKRGWSVFTPKTRPEARLSDQHLAASRSYQPINPETIEKVQRDYLQQCWKFPCYGAAYFNGQTEKPSRFNILGSDDNPVYVAVNTEGVCIIDMDKVELLVSLMFYEMSFDIAEPVEGEDKDRMPCLFLQFEDRDEDRRVSRVLQIFSKEATLMDAIIEACMGLCAQQGGFRNRPASVSRHSGEIPGAVKRLDKLCVSTFNKHGDTVKSKVRAPSTKGRKQTGVPVV